MECIPCGDPPPPYEPHCKHLSFLLLLLTVGLTSVGHFVKLSHENRLVIRSHNWWCFKMKQQWYNSLKANITSYSTLLISWPNATRTKTQQQSLYTHNMPAQSLWSNQNHSLYRVEQAIVFYQASLSQAAMLQYVQINTWIYKHTVAVTSGYQQMIKWANVLQKIHHWYFQSRCMSVVFLKATALFNMFLFPQ